MKGRQGNNMADKALLIKAVKGDQVQTMDIPVSGTALAIDVCYNLHEKLQYLRNNEFTIESIVYGFPIYCSCGILVDVHPEIEGFQKYCKVCEMQARNLITYNQMQN